jgi:hypothetical protein
MTEKWQERNNKAELQVLLLWISWDNTKKKNWNVNHEKWKSAPIMGKIIVHEILYRIVTSIY